MKKIFQPFILILVLFLVSTGCSSQVPEELPTVTPMEVSPTSTIEIPPTEVPKPGRVILVAQPEHSSRARIQVLQTVLEDLTSTSGLLFESMDAINSGDVTDDIKIILFTKSPENMGEFINSSPTTQLIILSGEEVESNPNVSAIRMLSEQRAFVAGFISVVSAPDLRSAALLPADLPDSTRIADAYINGGRYFCGICNPVYVPLVRFPLYYSLPSTSDLADWQAGVDQLSLNIIYVYYVDSEISSIELMDYILNKNANLIGESLPAEEIRSRWVASISFDLAEALRQVWPQVIAGEGGQSVTARIKVTDNNPQFLSEGRMRMVEEVIRDLESGLIHPLSIP